SLNMLGMMNHRNDSFEFYASGPVKNNQNLSTEDTKVFTEPKHHRKNTLTKAARVDVDDNVVEGKDASALWTGLIFRAHHNIPSEEKKENNEPKDGVKADSISSNEPPLSSHEDSTVEKISH
ncbi:hypothetical protein PENTCL1PPCAC_14375, partial [Pristionchus entomophagus]